MSSTSVRQLRMDELPGLEGEKLGTSEWHEITQSQVQMFADATGDQQWIHVDPERAKGGPFGGPVAHGFLTLSLEPVLLDEIFAVAGGGTVVNYGLNKVRFPAPVPVGGKRTHARDAHRRAGSTGRKPRGDPGARVRARRRIQAGLRR